MSLGDGAPTASDNGATVPNSDDGQLRDKRRRLQRALQSLRAYNPEFRLTPEVLEIMRVFFDDLKPDASDTISLGAIAREIERLDPDKQLVPDDTRHRMWREIEGSARGDDFRLDFPMFCRWVLRWREINPLSVQNVYETWARELATVDFGTSEGEDVYVVIRPDDALSSEELAKGIKELLHARKKQQRDGAELTKRRSFGAQDDAGANPSLESSPASQTPKDDEFENEDGGQSKDGPVAALAKKGSIITTSKSFIAGGAAGIVAKSMLAPMDRVKMLFQVTDKHKFSFRNAILLGRQIVAQDGAQALFRGNMLNIVRVVPYAGIQHSGFDYFRRRFRAYNYRHAEPGEAPKLSNAQLVAAGSLAGALSLMIAYPLDTIRARYMVQHGKLKYHSVFDAVMTMYRVDGIRSFSKGLVPSLIGTLPYTGIGFSLNERFKYWMADFQYARHVQAGGYDDGIRPTLNPASKFVCSYFAACIAQTITYPMDTIRRRIQTDGYVTGAQGELRYTGIVTTARIILTREGWRGLFKGVSVNWMRSPLSTGISLTTYDVLKDVMGIEKVE